MRATLKHIKADRNGATAIEYAMIALLISIAAFSVIVTVGSDVTSAFTKVSTSF
jgi:Flp pilus assembly pilin Flp